MNRKREQAELFFQLGQLFGPMLKMAENPDSYDKDERTRILARYAADVGRFKGALQAFTIGEPGHNYEGQYYRAVNAIGPFSNYAWQVDDQTINQKIKQLHNEVFEAVYAIPVPVESAIHEAHTPFSTYCLVKDLCSTSRNRIAWMDRYFDQTLFQRYFVDTPKMTVITLVTYPEAKCVSARDRQRYSDFMGVSKLFAQERGPSGYRLLTDEQFHDRWLECDDKMFSLGGSIKDLGNDSTFTISKLDSTAENQKHFDDAVVRGTEVFGPTQTTHP